MGFFNMFTKQNKDDDEVLLSSPIVLKEKVSALQKVFQEIQPPSYLQHVCLFQMALVKNGDIENTIVIGVEISESEEEIDLDAFLKETGSIVSPVLECEFSLMLIGKNQSITESVGYKIY